MEKPNRIELQKSVFPKIASRVPGTLIYKGDKVEPFKIEMYSFNENEFEKKIFSRLSDFLDSPILKEKKENIKWVNVTGISHTEEIKKFEKLFGIPNYILEQVIEISKHSAFKITEDFLYSDLQMIYYTEESMVNENIGLLLKDELIFTFQEKEGDVFQPIRERIEKKLGVIREKDLGYSYFCLLDALVDNYINSLNWIERKIEIMEEQVVELEPIEINAIHEVRKQLMIMKFSVNPMDKLIQTCNVNNILGEKNVSFLESLNNHIKEVQNMLVIQKEMIDSVYENYMLNNSNDMNKIMTTLTVFSAVFIPLSFLAGVFGMNFEYIPGLDATNGFFYFIGGCSITTVFMFVFFKLKDWF